MKFIIKVYIFIFLTILISIVYLYASISKVENTLNNNLENLFVMQAKEIAQNINEHLKMHIHKDIYKEFKSNIAIRKKIEHSLETVITQNYQYVYILYRDKNGDFRYLLDGSKKDRGEFDAKLNVLSEKWDDAYRTQKDLLIHQKDMDTLWMTYLKPVIINGKSEAIIAIDFSLNLPQKIREATAPTRDILMYIFSSIGLLLLILLYQTILNLKTKKESIVDSLTEVYNRQFLRKFIEKIDMHKYQIMMLDIDYFKKVNDNFGHDTGDYVLSCVAKILKKEIRDSDVLVRFGGEEFLLFLKRNSKENDIALKIAQRMRQSIQDSIFDFNDKSIRVTISIGLTLNPEHFKTVNEAIKYADNMLYIAKKEGRNRVIHNREHSLIENNIQDISAVKEAIESDKLFCQFQPIYDINKNSIAKYEALVRLKSPTGSVIYPNDFLDAIMQTNVYRDMTKSVIKIVFQKIKIESVFISINLNFSDILDDDIFESMLEEIQKNSQLASWLSIELLEYEQLDANKLVKKRLLQIKEFGVQIAVDDFGSGFANYDIFNLIPIDVIKIDGSLIKNINDSKISYSIVKSIATLAKELEIDVIAEYIETKEILEILNSLDIKYGQGYYLAKPTLEIQR